MTVVEPTPALLDALRAHLLEWLPRQGWFDADDAELTDVEVLGAEPIRREWPLLLWLPVEATVDDAPVRCQIVLGLGDDVPDAVPDIAVIGEVTTAAGPRMAYEALADAAAVSALLAHVGVSGGAPAAAEDVPWLTTVPLGSTDELVLYRRLQPGAQPDVELPGALGADVRTVRPPQAVWRGRSCDVAAVRARARRGSTGTELAQASLHDVLRRRSRPDESGVDVAASLTDLGRDLAELHVAAAARFGSDAAAGGALADALVARLPRRLDDAAAATVAGVFRRLAFADDLGRFVRVHGNLGLDTVELSTKGWTFTQFGCSPWSELMFETQPLSPLGDLAGLLHDLAAVASAGLDSVGAEVPTTDDDGTPDLYAQASRRELTVLAEAWEERGVDAVVAGYTSVDAVHRLLPVERISRDALLTVFELELSVRALVRQADRADGLLRLPVETVDAVAARVARIRW